MAKEKIKLFRKLKFNRIVLPVLIGIGVVFFMFYREYEPGAFSIINFTWASAAFLLIAFLLMIFRDVGYIIRLKILSGDKLSWYKSFRIIMLWEFTSAITPSAIGGTSLAILYVNKEGLSLGKSSAVVMATSFLDELYFIILFPLLLLFLNPADLFTIEGSKSSLWTNEFFLFASIGYLVKLVYTLFVSYGLFINPRGLKFLLLWIFRLPVLRRWRHGANDAGTEIIASSRELKQKSFLFWLKAFMATVFSWTSRYWVANALLAAFFVVSDHFLIFARQLVMWIMMLVSPTPGGSGFAEFVFSRYLGEFIPATPETAGLVIVAMAFIWRVVSYYPYLLMGVIILPRWLQSHFGRKQVNPT